MFSLRVVLRNCSRYPSRAIQTSCSCYCPLPTCSHGSASPLPHPPRRPLASALLGFPDSSLSRFASTQGIPSVEADAEEAEAAAELGNDKGAVAKRQKDSERDPKDRTRLIPWQTSVEYMKSSAYSKTYGTLPVWKPYRRPHKGGIPPEKTRPTCVEKGKIIRGSPCPICRDEYLVLDYRNTDLLKQFISPFSGEVLSYQVTNLCQSMHNRMLVEMEKAKYFGTMQSKVPFRRYDYSDYYKTDTSKFSSSATENAPQPSDAGNRNNAERNSSESSNEKTSVSN